MTMRKSLEAQPATHTRGGVKKEQQRDLQPLWRRIYCRSQTEKRQNDPFCTFCSLQMATQVVWKCIPRQCKSKKLHFRWNEKKYFCFSHHCDQHPSARNNKNPKISLSSFLLVIGKNRSILGRRQKNAIRFDHSDHMTAPFGSGLSFCPIFASHYHENCLNWWH